MRWNDYNGYMRNIVYAVKVLDLFFFSPRYPRVLQSDKRLQFIYKQFYLDKKYSDLIFLSLS